jgi:hypothetical protein
MELDETDTEAHTVIVTTSKKKIVFVLLVSEQYCKEHKHNRNSRNRIMVRSLAGEDGSVSEVPPDTHTVPRLCRERRRLFKFTPRPAQYACSVSVPVGHSKFLSDSLNTSVAISSGLQSTTCFCRPSPPPTACSCLRCHPEWRRAPRSQRVSQRHGEA